MKFDFSDETGKIGANSDNILVKSDIGDSPPLNVGESRWQQWLKSRTSRISAAMVKRNGSDDEIDLTERLLALGTASVMAMVLPLEASAAVIPAVNPSSIDLTVQGLDLDGDGLDDISGLISSTTNSWTNFIYASVVGLNGAEVSGNLGTCLPGGSGVAVGNLNGFQSSCLLLDNFNTENPTMQAGGESTGLRFLGIKTSSGKFGWAKVQVNLADNSLQVLDWAYESCAGKEIVTGVKTGGEASCESSLPPLPPSTLSPPVVNSDNQVTLTWADHNSNETGFKIYRDGKLVTTLPANATSYTDTSLPCAANSPYIYEIRTINSQGDSEPVAVAVTIGNICFPRGAMLFTAADGAGSGKVGSSPGGLSCAVKDCYDDPKDLNHQICDKDQCNVQLEIGTVVKLIPQAETGSEFSSWGGHQDCQDGEVTLTENKLCVAYFRTGESPTELPSLTDGKKDSTRSLSLPSMVGMEICPDGKQNENTATQFSGGVLINGKGDFETTATVTATDGLEILGRIKLAPLHLPWLMDVFVHGSYQATGQSNWSSWMMDENRNILPWDDAPANLVPFLRRVAPSATDELSIEIYQGTLSAKGIVEVTFGYRLLEGTLEGTIVCTSPPIEVEVK